MGKRGRKEERWKREGEGKKGREKEGEEGGRRRERREGGGGGEKEGRRRGRREGGGGKICIGLVSLSNTSYVVSCVGKLMERQEKKKQRPRNHIWEEDMEEEEGYHSQIKHHKLFSVV